MNCGAILDPARRQVQTTAAYLNARLTAALAAVYPGGALTSLVDTVEPAWAGVAAPSGCASITRYTVTNPGGRSGGTAIYAHLLNPSAAALGKCVVWNAGHVGWWDTYCTSTEANVIPQLLAAGYHVLAVDMPNYGLQPQQAVVLNGSLVTMPSHASGHIPGTVPPPWDTPSLVRLYTDHIVRGMNQITHDLGITTFALIGHSGGGCAATLLAPLESRFKIVHLLQGSPYATEPSHDSSDYESYGLNDCWYGLVAMTYQGAATYSAMGTGRLLVLHDDGYFVGDQSALWMAWQDRSNIWYAMSGVGGNVTFRQKLSVTHSIDQPQVDFILAHLGTYL